MASKDLLKVVTADAAPPAPPQRPEPAGPPPPTYTRRTAGGTTVNVAVRRAPSPPEYKSPPPPPPPDIVTVARVHDTGAVQSTPPRDGTTNVDGDHHGPAPGEGDDAGDLLLAVETVADGAADFEGCEFDGDADDADDREGTNERVGAAVDDGAEPDETSDGDGAAVAEMDAPPLTH